MPSMKYLSAPSIEVNRRFANDVSTYVASDESSIPTKMTTRSPAAETIKPPSTENASRT